VYRLCVVLAWGDELVWFAWQSLLSVVRQAVCSIDFRAIFALFLASSARAALLARPDELAEHS
jgi:Trp operon repressor